MNRKHSLFFLLITVIIIALLHYVGFLFQLYWRLRWYDRVVHVLSGFWAAYAILLVSNRGKVHSNGRTLFVGLGAAMIIGVLWELFELQAGATHSTDPNFMKDTIGDLISDMAGAGLATGYFISKNQKHRESWKNQTSI